jgi:hypothetical protein
MITVVTSPRAARHDLTSRRRSNLKPKSTLYIGHRLTVVYSL